MAEGSKPLDPYAAVLADLRAKRAEIDQAISVLSRLSGKAGVVVPTGSPDAGDAPGEDRDGAFLGMSIPDAAIKLLAMRKRKMGNAEIYKELDAGGLVLTSKDPVNTIGSVLTRRFNTVGDIVRVDRGTWGLKAWYPGRNFKVKAPINDLPRAEGGQEGVIIEAHEGPNDQDEGIKDLV